ncbi:dihydrodipicolinate synthase family protein [Fictibacillus fluitans]|uniref:Dihydrodipicolinate synthase family protein n=1 Tax=Fictibacillus fluitans TaxID=3058422 RepID=A0ABT8HVW6_9BACL|nr:dihydrodipicolinate synthase family protein [Fictibacillus sp. NE201]MDN4524924.1 dihydrodipicolinate synthase family protein [Fictibacillus sp. NE201]
MLNPEIKKLLLDGTVIPAHPLALNRNRQLDETSQRRLTNYYMDSGAGGVAVGVHTTQFEIRDQTFNLYEKVLRLAAEEVDKKGLQRPFIKVAGICGKIEQAESEAFIARSMGYDLGLLSPGGLNDLTEAEMLERTRRVSEILPVFGFYLQPSVGGRVFSYEFWRAFADIPDVHAIKMAPFNRYQTLDVIRAVCQSERRDEIALYTGNDDNIVHDLLTSYEIDVQGQRVRKEIAGGLLGHWAVWTKRAVELLDEIKQVRNSGSIPASLLQKGLEITDTNAAFFDAANGFKGSIAGINEVLARQGLIQGNWCLLGSEQLSPGQSEEIDRVYKEYPHLSDDDFVKACMHSS